MAKPIPDGFNTLTPHIIVSDAAKAISFYCEAFGAKEVVRHMTPDGSAIMNAQLKVGNSMLMLANEFPQWNCVSPLTLKGSSTTLHLYVEDADSAFDRAVKAGCKITMPVSDTFWGDRYGCLEDPFGHKWSIATHKQDLTQTEVAANAKAAFSKRSE
jgi:PhnB protein